jgi:hypothetical protein
MSVVFSTKLPSVLLIEAASLHLEEIWFALELELNLTYSLNVAAWILGF